MILSSISNKGYPLKYSWYKKEGIVIGPVNINTGKSIFIEWEQLALLLEHAPKADIEDPISIFVDQEIG